MSSQQLCDLLEELGVKGGNHTPENLAWTCQHEGSRSIIKWLCGTITRENILTLEELAEFEELKKAGKVLEGDELERLFKQNVKGSEYEELEVESVIQDTLEEIQDLQERKSAITQSLDKLRDQKLILENELTEGYVPAELLQEEADAAAEDYRLSLERSKEQDKQLECHLDDVGKVLNQAEEFYCGHVPGSFPDLVSLHVGPFLRQSGAFLEKLLQRRRAEFDVDFIQSREPLPETSGGESQPVFARQTQELNRLCRMQAKAQQQKVLALAELARHGAELEHLRSSQQQQERAKAEYEPVLRARLKSEGKGRALLEKENAELRMEVADKCALTAELARARVLKGHLESVEGRLREFTRRYDTFLSSLASLLSLRLALLWECTGERGAFGDLCAAMAALQAELSGILSNCKQRMEGSVKLRGGEVSDGLAGKIAHMLGSSNPTEQLWAQLEGREEDLAHLLSTSAAESARQMNTLLAHNFQLLCSESGQTEMIPNEAQEEMAQLTALMREVEDKIRAFQGGLK